MMATVEKDRMKSVSQEVINNKVDSTPKVSIGLPVYNGENFVAEAIESVLNQTFPDFELVISDNGSTDGTRRICEYYAALDKRIRYHRIERNQGAAWNFNHTFELSSGEYFKWLAHDDLIEPQFLERCVQVLDENPTVVLCYSQVRVVDEDASFIEDYDVTLSTDSPNLRERFRASLLEWQLCFDIFGLVRTCVLRRIGLMGNYGHADGVMLTRLVLIGPFHKVQERLMLSRRHRQQSMRIYGYEGGGNDYHRYAVWFDPKHSGRKTYPNWRMAWEYYRSIWETPLKLSDRVVFHGYMLRWMRSRARNLLSDLAHGQGNSGALLRVKRKLMRVNS